MKIQLTLLNQNTAPAKEVLRINDEEGKNYSVTFLDKEFRAMIEETGGIQIPPNTIPALQHYRQIAIPEEGASSEENRIFIIAFRTFYFDTQLAHRNYKWAAKQL